MWRLDPADEHEVVEIDGAELGAVNLMNTGVKRRSGPSGKLLEVGVDDSAEAAVVAEPLFDPADRIGEGVAIVAEGQSHPFLFEL
jgi:hypothetical protein